MHRSRGTKNLFTGLCLILLAASGMCAILGSGGSGGDSATEEGAVRFYLDLVCHDDTPFTATFTMGGVSLTTRSSTWSRCARFSPGAYRATVAYRACGGNINRPVNVVVANDYTTNVTLSLRDGQLVVLQDPSCPGPCQSASKTDPQTEEVKMDALTEELDTGTVKTPG